MFRQVHYIYGAEDDLQAPTGIIRSRTPGSTRAALPVRPELRRGGDIIKVEPKVMAPDSYEIKEIAYFT